MIPRACTWRLRIPTRAGVTLQATLVTRMTLAGTRDEFLSKLVCEDATVCLYWCATTPFVVSFVKRQLILSKLWKKKIQNRILIILILFSTSRPFKISYSCETYIISSGNIGREKVNWIVEKREWLIWDEKAVRPLDLPERISRAVLLSHARKIVKRKLSHVENRGLFKRYGFWYVIVRIWLGHIPRLLFYILILLIFINLFLSIVYNIPCARVYEPWKCYEYMRKESEGDWKVMKEGKRHPGWGEEGRSCENMFTRVIPNESPNRDHSREVKKAVYLYRA